MKEQRICLNVVCGGGICLVLTFKKNIYFSEFEFFPIWSIGSIGSVTQTPHKSYLKNRGASCRRLISNKENLMRVTDQNHHILSGYLGKLRHTLTWRKVIILTLPSYKVSAGGRPFRRKFGLFGFLPQEGQWWSIFRLIHFLMGKF